MLDKVLHGCYQNMLLFSAAGQRSRYSVLDKVVPGYYYRRMENGDICMSTCCNNTASEHAMCERLIIDDIVHWAKDYKVTASLCMLCELLILGQKNGHSQVNRDQYMHDIYVCLVGSCQILGVRHFL